MKALVGTALEESFKEGAKVDRHRDGEPGNPDADVLLRVKDDRLWIVRPDRPWWTTPGAYDETPSVSLAEDSAKLAANLKTAVWSLARAAKLIRVTSAFEARREMTGDIAVKASMAPAPARDAKAACKTDAAPETAQASPISPLLPAAAGNCDFVSIEITNDGDTDYYVAGFLRRCAGRRLCHARQHREVRLRPSAARRHGKKLSFKFWIDTWDEKTGKPSTVGAENFVLLAVPKDASGAAPRLCALTQPTLTAMQQTRSVEAGVTRGTRKHISTLMDGIEGGATRGASAATEDESGPGMTGRLFVFDVKP